MTARDVVVSVQDGNYKMAEVARVSPPEDAGPAQAVTITFVGGSHRPTSIRVEYWRPSPGAR